MNSKKFLFILFLLTIRVIFTYSDNTEKINTLFPSLEYQLNNADIKTRVKDKIYTYIDPDDEDIVKSMQLVLQEEIYEKYMRIDKNQFKIDGKDTEWENVPDRIIDKAGETAIENADLIEFKCYLDNDYNLYVMHRTKGKPLKKDGEEAFFTRIKTVQGRNINITYSWNGRHCFYRIDNGKSIMMDMDFKVDETGEALIPLGKLLDDNNIEKTGILMVEGSVYHKLYFDYSYYITVSNKPVNYALQLFAYLIENNCYFENDNIPAAFALANNYLYSIADNETRQAIKKDLIKHFEFYKKVLEFQDTFDIKYDLQKVPIVPKIFWADRKRHLDGLKNNVLTLEVYNEFIDRIENLEFMLGFAEKLDFNNASSFENLAHNIEYESTKRLIYRTRIEYHRARTDQDSRDALKEYEEGKYKIEYFGRERIWSHLYWLNYQVRLYIDTGKFKGDCLTATTIMMNLYKSCGIPVLSMQWSPVKEWGYSHNFPFYYNVFYNKWDCIQRPGAGEEEKFLYQYFVKLVWHHRIYNNYYKKQGMVIYNPYYQGEKGSIDRILSLLENGYKEEDFEEVFFSDKTQEPGLIFNDKTAPGLIKDSDNDGIPDRYEISLRMNPISPDTDSDGFSDNWEIEHGYDPKNSLDPKDKNITAVDGILRKENIKTVYSPQNDYKADEQIYDVKSLSSDISGNNIYLGVSYYNDITMNTRKVFSFRITGISGEHADKYWVEWIDNKTYIFKYVQDEGKEKLSELIDQRTCLPVKIIKDAEFLVPLDLFNDPDELFIQHFSSGVNRGKVSSSADRSKTLRLVLKNNNYNIEEKIMNSETGVNFTDSKDDYQAVFNPYDIKNFKINRENNKLILIVNFYNDIKFNDFTIHSFDIKDTDNNRFLFLQTWNIDMCNFYIYKDKKQEKHKLDLSNFFIDYVDNSLIFIYDIDALGTGNNIEIRYRAGGSDADRHNLINSDLTDYMEFSIK